MDKDKIADLQKKIDAAQKAQEDDKNLPPKNTADSMNKGMQILTEMIGIMVASGTIGYFIDVWLQTSPAGILILLVLGMVTFFYKMIKMTKKS